MTSTGLVRGTSLTIPTSTLKRVVGQLSAHGKVRKSYLGLSMQPVQLPDPVREVTKEEIGLLVVAVEDGGPAAQAGVQYGDTLLHLGDDSVRTLHDLYAYLRQDRSGQPVPVKLYRNGQVQTLQVTLGAK
jgi:S1-C subfamily serine protease